MVQHLSRTFLALMQETELQNSIGSSTLTTLVILRLQKAALLTACLRVQLLIKQLPMPILL